MKVTIHIVHKSKEERYPSGWGGYDNYSEILLVTTDLKEAKKLADDEIAQITTKTIEVEK
jgi:hypothetical protein